jgi:hypothetical protein
MRGLSIALASIGLLAARGALATTASQIPCLPSSPAPMPCVVDSSVSITASSILDFETRGLTITTHGELDAGGGDMAILAESVVVQAGGLILSRAGSIDITTTGDIRIEVSGTVRGRIDVSGDSGGFLTLTAGGELVIAGQLLGTGDLSTGDGASIDVTGRNVTLSGRISATGGPTGVGGDISVSAVIGGVTMGGTIDASGGDGGAIAIDADADVTLIAGALIDGNAAAGGSGDTIDITSYGGDITLAGTIRAHAPGDVTIGGGSGADLCVDAFGTITNNASIDVSGGGLNGLGGSAEFTTDGNIIQRGPIDASAAGNGGYAGLLSFTTSVGTVDLGGADIDVTGPGSGGDVSAFSYNGIQVANRITTDGPAASIDLQGCTVDVLSTARLSSVGLGGVNALHASGQMTVAGTRLAAQTRLEYRDATMVPIVTGSVSPPVTPTQNPALIQCGGPPTTTTSTTTSTTLATIPTTTSSTTSTTTTVVTNTTATLPPTTTTTTIATTTTATVAPTTSTTSTTVATSTSTTQAPATSTTSTTQTAATTTTSTLPSPVTCDPPDCNDVNACTEDVCDPERGCVHTDRTGFDAITCRLQMIVDVLASAPADDVGGPATRGKFQAKVTKVQRMVDAGRNVSGKRQVAKLKRANKLLTAFIHTVEKGEHRGKVKGPVGKEMTDLASGAQSSLLAFIL